MIKRQMPRNNRRRIARCAALLYAFRPSPPCLPPRPPDRSPHGRIYHACSFAALADKICLYVCRVISANPQVPPHIHHPADEHACIGRRIIAASPYIPRMSVCRACTIRARRTFYLPDKSHSSFGSGRSGAVFPSPRKKRRRKCRQARSPTAPQNASSDRSE